jgi:hypothetical protein
MGHCVCTDRYTCPWCRAAIERAKSEREHGATTPIDTWDIDAAAADMDHGTAA